MYGNGDTEHQYEETVSLLNVIVVDFVKDLLRKVGCCKVLKTIEIPSLLYVIRNNKRYKDRVCELLDFQKEINNAKKQKLKDEKKWFKK